MDFFGIGPLELLVILIVALLVLGPDQLPKIAYRLGNVLNRARSAIAETRDRVLTDIDVAAEPQASHDRDEPRPVSGRQAP